MEYLRTETLFISDAISSEDLKLAKKRYISLHVANVDNYDALLITLGSWLSHRWENRLRNEMLQLLLEISTTVYFL